MVDVLGNLAGIFVSSYVGVANRIIFHMDSIINRVERAGKEKRGVTMLEI